VKLYDFGLYLFGGVIFRNGDVFVDDAVQIPGFGSHQLFSATGEIFAPGPVEFLFRAGNRCLKRLVL
jgi:hypothetical protein